MAQFRTLLPFPTREYGPADRTGRRSSILTLDESDDIQLSGKVVTDAEGDEFVQIRLAVGGAWLELAVDDNRNVLAIAEGSTEKKAWEQLVGVLTGKGWRL